MTHGDGVDVVYDPVGGELAEQALRCTGWHGRYLVIGFASGEIPRLPVNLLLLKEASLTGVWYGPWAERHNDELRQNAADLDAMIEAGALKPRYCAAFPLEDFREAFRLITERRVLGKVVLSLR